MADYVLSRGTRKAFTKFLGIQKKTVNSEDVLQNVEEHESEESIPIHRAVKVHNIDTVLKLIKHDKSCVHARDHFLYTPLHIGVLWRAPIKILQALLDAGADIDALEE